MRLSLQRPVLHTMPTDLTLRTVRFVDGTANDYVSMGSSPSIYTRRTSTRPIPRLLGMKTKYKPLYLLALGNMGSAIFGSGEVVVQRAIWPSKPYQGFNPNGGVTAIPGGTAGLGMAFGGPRQGLIGGSILMVVGVGAALASAVLFVKDGRALNRRQNPENPNYRRTMTYFSAHLVGIGLLVSHRFALEVFRVYLPPDFLWAGTLPGAIGQAVFAVTMAQSFSSCEVYNGKMPLKHRGAISMAARAGVAFYIFVGAIVGTPNLSAYWRESVRLVAQTSTALAYSLPLTTARLGSAMVAGLPRFEEGTQRRRGDFTTLQTFAVYALSRIITSVAATQMQHSAWPAVHGNDPPLGNLPRPPAQKGESDSWRNLPPPIPTGAPDGEYVALASAVLVIGTGMGVFSFWQLRKDALAHGTAYANACFGGAVACLMLGNVFRVVGEHSKETADFQLVWAAAPIGFVANALANVVIPELYSASEVTCGNEPIKYRYQVTEACRAGGNLAWTLWSAMAATLNFPPLVRQGMIWAASVLTILGMALPDADTRRAQIGSATPPVPGTPQWLATDSSSRG